jgi:hypothetical protein
MWLRIGSKTVHFGFHERKKIVGLARTFFTHTTKLYRLCTTITVVVNTRSTRYVSFFSIPTKTNKNCIILKAVSANQTSKTYPIPVSCKASQPWHKQAIFRNVGTVAKRANQLRHVRPSAKYHRGPQWTDFPDV